MGKYGSCHFTWLQMMKLDRRLDGMGVYETRHAESDSKLW